MTTNSDPKRERRAMFLRALQKPMTLEALQEEFRVNYITVYRTLKELIDEGLVKEAPFRDGMRKLFVVSGVDPEDKTRILIYSPKGTYTLGQLISVTQPNPVESMSLVLAQVWRYSMYANATGIDKAKAGSMSPATVKPQLRAVLESVNNLAKILEQLLLADIWDGNASTIAERFGDVNEHHAITRGEEFERRVRGG